MSWRGPQVARALTLFEVIISIALIAMLLAALLTFFWQTLAIREQAAAALDRTQIVQQVLDRMSSELRNAIGCEQVGFPITCFAGDRRSITFVTNPLPGPDSYAFYRESEVRPMPEHDLREITYALWIDPEETTEDGEPLVGGILRTERRAINPLLTEAEIPEDEDLLYLRHDLWSPELGYLEFRFFDGIEWNTTWNVSEGNPLPQLIQITVGFTSLKREDLEDQDLQAYPLDQYPTGPDVPNPDHYSAIVRLAGADQMFTSRMNNLGSQVEEVYQSVTPGAGGEEETGGGK